MKTASDQRNTTRRGADAPVSGRARKPRRRGMARRWLAVVVILIGAVFAGGAVGIGQLRDSAERQHELRVVVANITAIAWHQSQLEWQALKTQQMTPAILRKRAEAHQASLKLYDNFVKLDPAGPEALVVKASINDYFVAVAKEFELLGEHQFGEALQYNEHSLEPVFDTLIEQLAAAEARYQASAGRASDRAQVGTVIILALAFLVICALMLSLFRSQARILASTKHQAMHDILTGLPNRLLFQQRLGEALRNAEAAHTLTTLLIIDLDRFKAVNDTYGHQVGDHLLVEAASRMRGTLRSGDTLARLGGDEFAVVLAETNPADAAAIAANMRAVLSMPFLVGGIQPDIGVSIGAATFPEDGHTIESLLRSADVAMYAAKASRSGFVAFDETMDTDGKLPVRAH